MLVNQIVAFIIFVKSLALFVLFFLILGIILFLLRKDLISFETYPEVVLKGTYI